MRDVLRYTSAILIACAGIIVLILWIIAANDRGKKVGSVYECHGCNYLYNDYVRNENFTEAPYSYSTGLNSWLKTYRNPFSILIAFGVILGVFWIVTGVIGFLATTYTMAKGYLIAGVFTYLIFVVVFPIIVERINFVQPYCTGLWPTWCRTDSDWSIRHSLDSYEEFWGAALVGFILGAFQIAAAIYLIYANREVYHPPVSVPPIPAAPAERNKP